MCESDLSMVRDSFWVDSLILFWASQCNMSLVGTPSMARRTSPAHRLAVEALLPGVTWQEKQLMTRGFRLFSSTQTPERVAGSPNARLVLRPV